MDFETLFKMIIAIAATVAIPVATYAAVAATRTIWGRRVEDPGSVDKLSEDVEALKERLVSLEAAEQRVLELEERLDFAERLLAQQRDASRLGAGEQR